VSWTGWWRGGVVGDAQRVAAPRAGRSILRSGLLSMLAVASLGVTRFVFVALLAHRAPQSVVAEVGVLYSLATLSSLALPAGAASAMSKFVPFHRGGGSPAAARAVYRFLSRLALAGGVVLGLAAGLVAYTRLHASAADALGVVLLAVSFSLYSVDKASLYGFDRVAPYTRLELTTSALAIATTALVVFVIGTGYLLPLALGYTVFVVGARFLVRRDVTGPGAPFDRREVGGFVVLACLGTLASTGFTQGLPLLARGLDVGAREVAQFTAVIALVAPLYFLPRALNLALFPAMAHAQGAGDLGAVRRHTDVSTRALVVVLAPLFGVAVLLAPELLTLYGGTRYAAAAAVLQVVLLGTYASVIQVAAVNALSSGSQRQVRIPVTSAVTGALVGCVLAALLAWRLGSVGLALGYALGTAVIAGGPIVATWRLHRMRWAGVLGRAFALLAVATVAAVWLAGAVPLRWAAAAGFLALCAVVLRRDLRGLVAVARSRG
jgi:O-antigen/teichoic acid export membrane protein